MKLNLDFLPLTDMNECVEYFLLLHLFTSIKAKNRSENVFLYIMRQLFFIFYCLVKERVMQDDECPWKILTEIKRVYSHDNISN